MRSILDAAFSGQGLLLKGGDFTFSSNFSTKRIQQAGTSYRTKPSENEGQTGVCILR